MNKIDLNGRCAVVTGGAQGFGRAITERFVSSGAKVAIWDHDLPFAEKTAKEIGARRQRVQGRRVGSRRGREDARRHAQGARQDRHSRQQCRHALESTRRLWETDLEEWRKVLRINLDGPFICCKAIAPAMISQGYGRIVNIASIAGKEGNPNAAHYSASKAGPDRADEIAGQGTGAARYPRQRGVPRPPPKPRSSIR